MHGTVAGTRLAAGTITDSAVMLIVDEIVAMPLHPRCETIHELATEPDPEAAVSILLDLVGQKYQGDPDCKVHWSVLAALQKLHGATILQRLLNALRPLPSHPNDDWRRYWIAKAIGRMRTLDAVSPLIELLDDADRDVASAAVESLLDLDDSIGLGSCRQEVLKHLRAKVALDSRTRDYLDIVCRKAVKELER
jgi:HEAT repeat protein